MFTSPAKKEEPREIKIPKVNEYKLDNGDYEYVSSTDNFVPENKQDIMDIIYTILNSGWKEFTFYCPTEYETCVDDVTSITNNVHPFNSFKTIETNYTTSGEISLIIHKLYSDEEIKEINDKVKKVIDENIKDNMSEEDRIKTIHDYIINNTKYDDEKISGVTKEKSNNAYGALIDGYAICSGYTDAMAIFLDELEIRNIKVSSTNHIWNLVYVNGSWKNLDLTFDDPITDTGEDVLNYDYFLVDTNVLSEKDKTGQHNYDKDVFVEANM